MPTIFTRIIDGEIPGRFVHSDDVCVAFMDVRPLTPGHVLVVPRAEVDQWTDLETDTVAHLMTVAHRVGRAQRNVLSPARIGVMIAGFEVPHVHVHVVPMNDMADLDFRQADPAPDQVEVERIHAALREALTQ
ncbi:MAG: HIT family protein [Acidimicrobiales bacterium]